MLNHYYFYYPIKYLLVVTDGVYVKFARSWYALDLKKTDLYGHGADISHYPTVLYVSRRLSLYVSYYGRNTSVNVSAVDMWVIQFENYVDEIRLWPKSQGEMLINDDDLHYMYWTVVSSRKKIISKTKRNLKLWKSFNVFYATKPELT